MEKLLHYIWKHRILPLSELRTTDGRSVEVIDPGLPNMHAGPDFFNAKVRIDGVMWVGNVEIHERSADWFLHGHDTDAAYNNVVLHVAAVVDADVVTERGDRLPQVQLAVPQQVLSNYRRLLAFDRYPPCREAVLPLDAIKKRSWLSALVAERLNEKTEAIRRRVALFEGSWEAAFFATMARSFGFGVNSEAFEQWAERLPLMQIAHHRDDPFQVEAMFMGMAGLLDEAQMTPATREAALADPYFLSLKREFGYLSRKFGLEPMARQAWRFLRLRPQNFPYIRMSQLAQLYCSRRAGLAEITACESVKQLHAVLQTSVSDYWRTHYTFGKESSLNEKRLSTASLNLLAINAAVPVLHAWGCYRDDERLVQRALDWLEELPAEENTYIRLWKECGVEARNAADTQALIQLQHRYCERKDCLRCRFGYYSLKRSPSQKPNQSPSQPSPSGRA
jgi:hypothetical protein